MITRLQVVTDIDTALAFYADILGFDLVADWRGDGDRMAFTLPLAGQTEIGLPAPGAGDHLIGTKTGFVFTADDVRSTVEELK